MTSNLPNQAALNNHFHRDARVAWAVDSGRTPRGVKPTAPPHDYSEFLKLMDAWTENGFPCPQ